MYSFKAIGNSYQFFIGNNKYTWNSEDFLGKGAFGSVYKGKNSHNGQIVAVKIMKKSNFNDPILIKMLKEEINVMKHISGDNVVNFYDFYETDDKFYSVLEFCDEGDLDDLLKKKGGMLDETLAIEILQQFLKGFKQLTDHGHRDIKPANALVKKPFYKVADFGFACHADIQGISRQTEYCGSPLYMSPQILCSCPYTSKTDIWSIGIMFYQLLFGKFPWPCYDLESYKRALITEQPLRFPYQKTLTKTTKDFLTKCLQVDENKRITWEEIYKHPINQIGHKSQQQQQQLKLNDKSIKVLNNIQKYLEIKHTDFNYITKKFNTNELNQKQFKEFVRFLDPRVTSKCIEIIFTAINEDKNETINIREFKKIMDSYDFSDLKDQSDKVIRQLRVIVIAKKLNINEMLKKYDVDHNGLIDFKEFCCFIQAIFPNIRNDDIGYVYAKFDKNKDGNISYQEFRDTLNGQAEFGREFNSQK